MLKPPRIEIVRPGNRGKKWWVRLRAKNHRIVFVSETYRSARAARRAAGILRGLALTEPLPIVETYR